MKMTDYRNNILVIGACGQIGTELLIALREQYGRDNVLAADLYESTDVMQQDGPYFKLDVRNKQRLSWMVSRLSIGTIYHLAAVLSAKGESNPLAAWEINMTGLLNVLEVARAQKVRQVFWPSSIAVYGPASLPAACTQHSQLDPATVYGISKQAGEYWCRYYFENYGLDVRSIRYPGLISATAPPGGGTTDYAVDIFHQVLQSGHYSCFLKENTGLPMLYMPDAIRGTLELMSAKREELTVRTAYNLAGMSFTPRELVTEIQKHLPDLVVTYVPDHRQKIADSWPSSILDLEARKDWGWKPEYNLASMTSDMLRQLKKVNNSIALDSAVLNNS
jgi:nucleoside-diphosphate-sugar epimerase